MCNNQQFIDDIKRLCRTRQFMSAARHIDIYKDADKINFALYEQACLYLSAMTALDKVRLSPDSDLWFNDNHTMDTQSRKE